MGVAGLAGGLLVVPRGTVGTGEELKTVVPEISLFRLFVMVGATAGWVGNMGLKPPLETMVVGILFCWMLAGVETRGPEKEEEPPETAEKEMLFSATVLQILE